MPLLGSRLVTVTLEALLPVFLQMKQIPGCVLFVPTIPVDRQQNYWWESTTKGMVCWSLPLAGIVVSFGFRVALLYLRLGAFTSLSFRTS